MVWLPNFSQFAQAIGGQLVVLLALMLIDLFFGIVVAIKARIFEFAKVADFMLSNLPKIVFWIAAEFIEDLLVTGIPQYEIVLQYTGDAIFYGLLIAFIGSIMGHAAALGVPKVEQIPGVKATEAE